MTLLAKTSSAQSGTRNPPQRTTPAGGSATRSMGSGTKATGNAVAIQGYCPVCVIEMKKWVKGDSQFAVQQDGKTYLFPSEERKQMFLKNPMKYTPALGGDCVVALVEMNKRVPGALQHVAMPNDRLYLFANAKAKEMFNGNSDKYVNADLALGGKCSVCRVEMKQDVNGAPQFTSVYQGMRYQFPGLEQQQMFNRNPAKYAVGK
ncbi:hypothetical protein [Rhodopirellula sp. SWK7]|uniref:hypothetical protein n=1 Tax=Rhodopirellula sp. SWK7 TaxID=595460 RepID=UPI001181C175|nr:hypothetical protein [Rhodopirellula sp. SWK7]